MGDESIIAAAELSGGGGGGSGDNGGGRSEAAADDETQPLLAAAAASSEPSADDETATAASAAASVDPFHREIHLTPWMWIRTIVLSLILFPIRLILVFLLIPTCWCMGIVATIGLSEEAKLHKPMVGWRKSVRSFACVSLGRLAFWCCGFGQVRVLGTQASVGEAPILVVAPHSTFFDGFVLFYCANMPYTVSRVENRAIPFIGRLLEMSQCLFADRGNKDSRQRTVRGIIDRAQPGTGWPQLLIFPEGTTSNPEALTTFKVGAFCAGRPVQPVLIRYPNKLDTITWTWFSNYGLKTIIWLTLSQPRLKASVEFLPVYSPSEAEAADPALFAVNVRRVMAEALHADVTDTSYEQMKELQAKEANIVKKNIFGLEKRKKKMA